MKIPSEHQTGVARTPTACLHWGGILAATATGLTAAQVWVTPFLLLTPLTLVLLTVVAVRTPRKRRAVLWILAALAAGLATAWTTWLVQVVVDPHYGG